MSQFRRNSHQACTACVAAYTRDELASCSDELGFPGRMGHRVLLLLASWAGTLLQASLVLALATQMAFRALYSGAALAGAAAFVATRKVSTSRPTKHALSSCAPSARICPSMQGFRWPGMIMHNTSTSFALANAGSAPWGQPQWRRRCKGVGDRTSRKLSWPRGHPWATVLTAPTLSWCKLSQNLA